MSKHDQQTFFAVGEEGIEFVADTEAEVQQWIDDEVAGVGVSGETMPANYYHITSMTKAELDALPEN